MQGPKWPLFYSHLDPVWSLLMLGQVCTLGRAPRTKETLPDFRERCRVTRHSRVFRGLTGYQRTPRFWGVTLFLYFPFFFLVNLEWTVQKKETNKSYIRSRMKKIGLGMN